MQFQVDISLVDLHADVANRYAHELETVIRRVDEDVEIRRHKEDASTMDLGTTLCVIIGSAAVNALAIGIADWLRKRHDGRLVFKRKDGTVIASNITSQNVIDLAKILAKEK